MKEDQSEPQAHDAPASDAHAIDWAVLRERLDKALAALQDVLKPTPAQAQAIMDERAERLSRIVAVEQQVGELLELVEFSAAHEQYALQTRYVQEAVRVPECVPLPGLPAFFVGACNFHGDVLAVVELSTFLGLPAGERTEDSRMLVLGRDQAEIGLIIDGVEAFVTRPASDFGHAVSFDNATGLFKGITGASLVLFDGDALLDDPRLNIDQSEGY
jgi:purine-binding chemotaxis protein CheW